MGVVNLSVGIVNLSVSMGHVTDASSNLEMRGGSKRCKICQDHEKEGQHSQVQGPMQSILVHTESQR